MSICGSFQRTIVKIYIARILCKIVHLFIRNSIVSAKRSGIRYELDLNEGIDLAIFLFGGFQKHIYRNRLLKISGPATIIDIGANIGSMSLMFARLFTDARIHAFEPTTYACEKMRRNLELNPSLAERITLVRSFVSDVATQHPDIKAYASWRVGGGDEQGEKHPVHLGTVKAADGAAATTLDLYCARNNLTDVRLIKIDTDGHEFQVLQGAKVVISSQRPYVLFEVGGYVMDEQGIAFDRYVSYFSWFDYTLHDSSNGRLITGSNWHTMIPRYGTIDVLAVPANGINQQGQRR